MIIKKYIHVFYHLYWICELTSVCLLRKKGFSALFDYYISEKMVPKELLEANTRGGKAKAV